MLNTFMVYVENKPGVLTRVASLFRRRAFNIDSLTVGRTEKPEVSRMTITVDAAYQLSRCRQVFHASVATRSPGLMPSRSSRCATRTARARISA